MLRAIPSSILLLLVYGFILTSFASESKAISDSHRIRRQSSTTQEIQQAGCKLPPPKQNGKFSHSKRRCSADDTTDHPLCQMTPGNLVPHNWPLYHTCDPGYALNGTTISVCLDGQWRPALPGCIRLCPPLKSPSSGVGIKCVSRGREMSCDSDVRPGTVASAKCPQFYRSNIEMTCLDGGNWTELNQSSLAAAREPDNDNNRSINCIPECGLSSNIKDTDAITNFPWVAGIYRKSTDDKWNLICAGTLISTHIVMTAAHCVFSGIDTVQMEPGDIRVGLGKTYSSFYRTESSSVILEVEKFVVHESYKGSPTFYAMDIAMLGLIVDVQMSAFILPACVDWSHLHTPATGTTVMLAGWSKTDNGSRGEIVTSAELKFIQNEDCYKSLQSRQQRYLTSDKSCVEKLDVNQTHLGISGAGITYEEEGRHFIIGFLSTKIPDHPTLLFTTDIAFGATARWLDNEKVQLEKIHVSI